MKKLLFGSCIAFSIVHADTNEQVVYADQWGGCAPYRIAPDNSIYFSGAGLWWEGSNVGAVVGFQQKLKKKKKHAEIENKTILLRPEFNWGFRVGAGYQMPFDDWELDGEWTYIREHFHTKEHSGHHEKLILSLRDAPLEVDSIHAHGHVLINYVDLALRREFLVTRYLGLKPILGLRNLWFKGESHNDFVSKHHHPNIHGRTKNDYWGIGPKLGLDTRWVLGWGLSIYGDLALALLYGRFKLENHGSLDNVLIGKKRQHVDVEIESSPRSVTPMTDLQIGLQWDELISSNDLHLNLFVGWEHHVFFQVGQADIAQLIDTNNSNFTTSGLTFGGRLDF